MGLFDKLRGEYQQLAATSPAEASKHSPLRTGAPVRLCRENSFSAMVCSMSLSIL